MTTYLFTARRLRPKYDAGHRRPRQIAPNVVLWLGVIYCLMPIVWVVTAATKSPAELFTTAPFVPGTGLWTNLQALLEFRGGVYVSWATNSLLYAGGGALACTVISAAAGFVRDCPGVC